VSGCNTVWITDECDLIQDLVVDIQANDFHVLRSLLLPESTTLQNYSLCPSVHNVQLPDHRNHLADSKFIVQMFFRNIY